MSALILMGLMEVSISGDDFGNYFCYECGTLSSLVWKTVFFRPYRWYITPTCSLGEARMGRAALAVATKQMELRQPESWPSPHPAPSSHWLCVPPSHLPTPRWSVNQALETTRPSTPSLLRRRWTKTRLSSGLQC